MDHTFDMKSRNSNPQSRVYFPIIGQTQTHFRVQAETDACVSLSYIPHVRRVEAYLLCIGLDQNSKTELKKYFGFTHNIDTPGILNVTESMYFWLTWREGLIRLGHGSSTDPYGGALILEMSDPEPVIINSISPVNHGESSDQRWTFEPQATSELHVININTTTCTQLFKVIYIKFTQM